MQFFEHITNGFARPHAVCACWGVREQLAEGDIRHLKAPQTFASVPDRLDPRTELLGLDVSVCVTTRYGLDAIE